MSTSEAVPLDSLRTDPDRFQFRHGEDPGHVGSLARDLTAGRAPFAPMVVWEDGADLYVLDGHHRLEAYRKAAWDDLVPVVRFEGTLAEARAEAFQRNRADKLPMRSQEKRDGAWFYARTPAFAGLSLRDITVRTGVSKSTVANMRRTAADMRAAGVDPEEHPRWSKARRELDPGDPPDFSRDDVREAQALAWRERLSKAIDGRRAAGNPEVFALALEYYLGERGAGALRSYLPIDPMDDQGDDAF